jgi:hypothetical protein
MIARTGPPAPPHPGPPSRWPTDSLGEPLVLVGDLENRRAELEERFPPLANPRAGTTDRAAAYSAPEQTRPDSSQASGRSFAADAPSPSRPG